MRPVLDPRARRASSSGAFRYGISGGSHAPAGADAAWSTWAWTGSGGLHVPSAFDCSGGDPGTAVVPGGIHRRPSLPWEEMPASRAR